ncbi:heat-inducible transcription repressor HrcA [Betaproteobacteria bacterium]|nr:heat-inducible transcription repressor HrcA [Betaproteobacteria bacterium]GHU14791.1 heat-inducible transcription repressor HrcA [Betaproteobacteria bacterium]GHU46525.1 heat-inducible transcription repressor HrcA [Betaproteobacteria bacterium]
MLDDRSRTLLKALIEHYIADGAPIGSRALSKFSGIELSPATVRNVMADLEEAGFVASPHTSAGRVPTALGYRLFVDSLLTMRPLEDAEIAEIGDSLRPNQPQYLIASASQLLSQLTHFAGIVATPKRAAPRIRQIEFLPLSDTRILLILITSDGDVQNRILFTGQRYSASELVEAANYLNQNFSGFDLEQIRNRVHAEVQQLRSELHTLMTAALEVSGEALAHEQPCVISGEKNLLDAKDLSSNMKRLRELFDLFEQRSGLMGLLEHSYRAEGVQIFIGGESGIASLDGCSVVTAPYEVDGRIVGSLGVIGPTRMAYERVIPIVDITARLLSGALSSQT